MRLIEILLRHHKHVHHPSAIPIDSRPKRLTSPIQM
jgi:hypothetical protein